VRILIAEDDPVTRRVLRAMLSKWGYQVHTCTDGLAAWQTLQATAAPPLVILDWMMPHMDGLQVCRQLRALSQPPSTYVILLTARGQEADIVTGLEAGADDYITKPFAREELRARVQVGARVVTLQRQLAERVQELEDALARVKYLRGLLPICAYCKKIRNDQNYWQQVESYIAEHSDAQFSHSICPACYEQFARPALERAKAR
jgi:DNA-binding response OmpR family regulator